MTSPTHQSVGTPTVNASATTTQVCAVPAGATLGRLMLWPFTFDANAATFTLPGGGWAHVAGSPFSMTFDGQTSGVLWKIATGSEPGNYTLTVTSGAARNAGVIVVADGNHATTPINAVSTPAINNSGNASPVTVTSGGLTTSVADTLLYLFDFNDDTGNSSGYTFGSGFTEIYDTGNTTGATWACAYKDNTGAAGAVAGVAATATGTVMTSGWGSILVAVAPPAGGGGGGATVRGIRGARCSIKS